MKSVAEALAIFRALPLTSFAGTLMRQRALVLAPHPDDESLGCGGMIAAACEQGAAPIVVVLTDGAASHPGSRQFPPARLRAVRAAETHQAVAWLGLPAENLVLLRYPDTELPSSGIAFEAACAQVHTIATAAHCSVVLAPWHGDLHCDHQAAARIGLAVATRLRLRLLSYPVWGWLRDGADCVDEDRKGGFRLDITQHLAAKRRAIAAHSSQYGDLITDSPNGFRLPRDLLDIAEQPYEVFIE